MIWDILYRIWHLIFSYFSNSNEAKKSYQIFYILLKRFSFSSVSAKLELNCDMSDIVYCMIHHIFVFTFPSQKKPKCVLNLDLFFRKSKRNQDSFSNLRSVLKSHYYRSIFEKFKIKWWSEISYLKYTS